ncbi:MAG: hypothetical protein LBG64_02820 [Pseudomonadales bacterium]|jgi:hypothetical protein|nr:hypothetical protein [Pseudomonadales bacterium]
MTNIVKLIINIFVFLTIGGVFLLIDSPTFALDPICMVCAATITTGLIISRALGLSDALVGVWAGGLFWTLGIWMGDFLQRKYPRIKNLNYIYLMVFCTLMIVMLYVFGYFTGGIVKFGMIINPLFAGIVSGAIFMIAAYSTNKFLRTFTKKGKAYFPYQKTILAVTWLIVGSVLLSLVFPY